MWCPVYVLTLMHAILFKEIFMLGKRGVTLWNHFQIHSRKYGIKSAIAAVILVVYRRHTAELMVVGTSAGIVVVHSVHCTLSTLFNFWTNWLLNKLASDELCFWKTSFWWHHLQECFLQTHYASDFPGALSFRCSSNFSLKYLCSLLMVLYTWINF